MKAILWFFSFVFLVIAAVVGLGVGINYLKPEWMAVCILAIALMFSAAEYADTIGE